MLPYLSTNNASNDKRNKNPIKCVYSDSDFIKINDYIEVLNVPTYFKG